MVPLDRREPESRPDAGAVGRAYDARAAEYVALFGHLDRVAPEDLALVTRWRDSVEGTFLDAGCGPGHWSGLLAGGGSPVVGVDLSERFLAHAAAAHPRARYVRATLTALPLRDASVGGVLAWFSTLHLPPEDLPGAFVELRRVLVPGGSLLLGHPDGTPGEAYAHAVTTAWFTSVDALRPLLARVGLTVAEHGVRHDAGARPSGWLVARAL